MEKTYKITDKKLEEAATIITSNGGSVHSDGSFELSGVKGSYKKEGEKLKVTITEKPSLASWKMIEGKLDEFFEDSK